MGKRIDLSTKEDIQQPNQEVYEYRDKKDLSGRTFVFLVNDAKKLWRNEAERDFCFHSIVSKEGNLPREMGRRVVIEILTSTFEDSRSLVEKKADGTCSIQDEALSKKLEAVEKTQANITKTVAVNEHGEEPISFIVSDQDLRNEIEEFLKRSPNGFARISPRPPSFNLTEEQIRIKEEKDNAETERTTLLETLQLSKDDYFNRVISNYRAYEWGQTEQQVQKNCRIHAQKMTAEYIETRKDIERKALEEFYEREGKFENEEQFDTARNRHLHGHDEPYPNHFCEHYEPSYWRMGDPCYTTELEKITSRLRILEENESKLAALTELLLIRCEASERLAIKLAFAENLDTLNDALQAKAAETAPSATMTYTLKDDPGVREITRKVDTVNATSASPFQIQQRAFEVHSLSLKHFAQKEIVSQGVLGSIKAAFSFVFHPISNLFRSLFSKDPIREPAQIIHPVVHEHVGEITHRTMLAQMAFVKSLFLDKDPTARTRQRFTVTKDPATGLISNQEEPLKYSSEAHQVADILETSYEIGNLMLEAQQAGTGRSGLEKRTQVVKEITARFEALNNEEINYILIPFGFGEGKEYTTHFFIIEGKGSGISRSYELKHVNLSAPTLAKEHIQTIITYQANDLVRNSDTTSAFIRSLIALMPYEDKAHAAQKVQKANTLDHSLSQLLLEYVVAQNQVAFKQKANRDPIKILYTVLSQLNLKAHTPEEVSVETGTFQEVISSKASFYQAYVNYFIAYVEANHAHLTDQELANAFKSIRWYAEQLKHYLKKELGVNAANSIVNGIMEFVDKKLEGLNESAQEEAKVINGLNSPVHMFSTKMDVSSTQQIVHGKHADVKVEQYRAPALLNLAISELSEQFMFEGLDRVEKNAFSGKLAQWAADPTHESDITKTALIESFSKFLLIHGAKLSLEHVELLQNKMKTYLDQVIGIHTTCHDFSLRLKQMRTDLVELIAQKTLELGNKHKDFISQLATFFNKPENDLRAFNKFLAQTQFSLSKEEKDFIRQQVTPLMTIPAENRAVALKQALLNIDKKLIADKVDALQREEEQKIDREIAAFKLQFSQFTSAFSIKTSSQNEIDLSLAGWLRDLKVDVPKSLIFTIALEHASSALKEIEDMKRTEIYDATQSILVDIEKLLDANNQKAAKVVCSNLMHALPPTMKANMDQTFWNTLDGLPEMERWSATLAEIGERMWEAAVRCGEYPLPPKDVIEFNITLPLVQRYLFDKQMQIHQQSFEHKLSSYHSNEEVLANLTKQRDKFIEIRKEDLRKEVTDKLRLEWAAEDRKEAEDWASYHKAMREYKKDKKAWEERQNNWDINTRSWRHYDPEPKEPRPKPSIEERLIYERNHENYAQKKKLERQEQLEREIQKAWANDGFLKDLRAIEVSQLKNSWNRLARHSSEDQKKAWIPAVHGSFARIIGITQKEFAYSYYQQHKGLRSTFKSSAEKILMVGDHSLRIDEDPVIADRYNGSKAQLLSWGINGNISNNNRIDLHYLTSFKVGYAALGNGLYVSDDKFSDYRRKMEEAHNGYFATQEEADSFFAPNDLTHIKKIDATKQMMEFPQVVDYFYTSVITRIKAVFTQGDVNLEALREALKTSGRLFLVVGSELLSTGKYFSISSEKGKPGGRYCLGKAEHKAGESASTSHRKDYVGESSVDLVDSSVTRDKERKVLENAHSRPLLKKSINNADVEFILRETILLDSKGEFLDPESPLSVEQCLHFIYQYADYLGHPEIMHTIYNRIFRQGLIRRMLVENPKFFIQFGTVFEEIYEYQAQKESTESALMLLWIAEGIRRELDYVELDPNLKKQISDTLPRFTEDRMVGPFNNNIGNDSQKIYAFYALLYFSKYPPHHEDSERWGTICKAYKVLLQSPIEIKAHGGLSKELHEQIQQILLPKLDIKLKENEEWRKIFLNSISSKTSTHEDTKWRPKEGRDYCFELVEDSSVIHTVDLRTGAGLDIEIKTGRRGELPTYITDDENFAFLFNHRKNFVVELESPPDGTQKYWWKDKQSEITYEVRVNADRNKIQIFQIFQGKKYIFERLKIQGSIWNKLFSHHNKTVEELISNKGIWIKVEEDGKLNQSHSYVAQSGQKLEDAIRLWMSNGKISAASLGEGKELRWICSGLSSSDKTLLTFRRLDNLLLLSRDKKHVDEIKFPDGLILKRSEHSKDKWVVSGREEWEWQLDHSFELEQRFGKDFRKYLLPLKNSKTGEEEFYIYPYVALALGKKGSEIKFITKGTDIPDNFPEVMETLSDMSGGMLDPHMIRGFVGIAENVLGNEGSRTLLSDGIRYLARTNGGDDGPGANITQMLTMGQQGDEDLKSQLLNGGQKALEAFFVPKNIRYVSGKHGEESTHAGFLYLAHLAHLRGDSGMAAHYLHLMVTKGVSSEADLEQLEGLIMQIFGLGFLFKGQDKLKDLNVNKLMELITPVDGRDAVFQLKMVVALNQIQRRLETQHRRNLHLLSDAFKNAIAKIQEKGYRKAIQKHRKEFEESGLCLSDLEERELQKILLGPESLIVSALNEGMGAEGLKIKAEQEQWEKQFTPLQYEIPTQHDIDELSSAIAKNVNPDPYWSIHKLHKTSGSYPKWNTLVSNFWEYVEWILSNDLSVEDLAFLHREPTKAEDLEREGKVPKEELCKEIKLARNFLLMIYYHKQTLDGLKTNNAPLQWQMQGIHKMRGNMPNLASMRQTLKRYQIAQGKDGSTLGRIFRMGRFFGYKKYVEIREKFALEPKDTNIGGVEYARGSGPDFFAQSSKILSDIRTEVVGSLKPGLKFTPNATLQKADEFSAFTPTLKTTSESLEQDALDQAFNQLCSMSSMLPPPFNFSNSQNPVDKVLKELFRRLFDIYMRSPTQEEASREVKNAFSDFGRNIAKYTSALEKIGTELNEQQPIDPNMFGQIVETIKNQFDTIALFLEGPRLQFQMQFPTVKPPKAEWVAVEVTPGISPDSWEKKYFVQNDSTKVWEKRKEQRKKYVSDSRENCGIEVDGLRKLSQLLHSKQAELVNPDQKEKIRQFAEQATQRLASLTDRLNEETAEIDYVYDNSSADSVNNSLKAKLPHDKIFARAAEELKAILHPREIERIQELDRLSRQGIGKMEAATNKKLRDGIDIMAKELEANTSHVLNIRYITAIQKKIKSRINGDFSEMKGLEEKLKIQKLEIFKFAKERAEVLGLLELFDAKSPGTAADRLNTVIQACLHPDIRRRMSPEENEKIDAYQKTCHQIEKVKGSSLKVEVQDRKQKILAFARTYATPLGLQSLFASGNHPSIQEKIFLKILELVKEGEIGKLGTEHLKKELVGQVVNFLAAATELQQLQKAEGVVKTLYEQYCALVHSLKDADIKAFQKSVADRLARDYETELNTQKEEILSFVSDHCEELNLRGDEPFEQILSLHLSDDDPLKEQLTQKIKVFKSLESEKTLFQAEKGLLEKALQEERALIQLMVQTKASEDVNWMLASRELLRYLSEGSNRTRYASIAGNEGVAPSWILQDPQYSIKYLVEDYLKAQITRSKAKDAIEKMLPPDGGNAVRFVQVRMGIGKSTFIFPLICRLSLEKGREPVVMTTEELLPQLLNFMDKKAFVFNFDINYGLKTGPNGEEAPHDQIMAHLSNLEFALESLKKNGRYVMTTPARLSALRNKRVQLQDIMASTEEGEERKKIFLRLEAVKRIEGYFKKDSILFYQDEDVNLDISFEYNYANGTPDVPNEIRLEMAEKIVRTMMETPSMQKMLVDNTLRSITQPKEAIRDVVSALYDDEKFWQSVGWEPSVWKKIDKEEFIEYSIGLRKELPTGAPEWNLDVDPSLQKHLCYMAAFKSLISRTFESVYGTHAKLDRGIKKSNGFAVVPYQDGLEKPQTQYGEEYEVILHHFLHYSACTVSEEEFLQKFNELKNNNEEVFKRNSTYYKKEVEPFKDSLGAFKQVKEKDFPNWIQQQTNLEAVKKAASWASLPIPETWTKMKAFIPELEKAIQSKETYTWISWAATISRFANRHKHPNGKSLEIYEAFSYPLSEWTQEHAENLQILQECQHVLAHKAEQTFDEWYHDEKTKLKLAKVALWMSTTVPPCDESKMRDFVSAFEKECFAMPKARLDFLRYVMTKTSSVQVFSEQIVCNSQDVTLGGDVFVGSGTGDVFALNLADPENDQSRDPKLISAETLLCLDLDQTVTVFTDPLEHMKMRAQDHHCRALINTEHEVMSNQMEKLVAQLDFSNRQFCYRDSRNRDKWIKNPGKNQTPFAYEAQAVDKKNSLTLYGPADTRGVDFRIPEGNHVYADAMFGLGTNADGADQALWRARQLGHGQEGHVSIDDKMSKRVLLDNHLEESNPSITIGHVINSIKKKSIKEDELNHQKAVIFKSKLPLKKQLDKLLSTPYQLSGIQDTRLLEEFESIAFLSNRSLNIVTESIKWAKEYQVLPTMETIEFLRTLYAQQLSRCEGFQKEFISLLDRFLKKPSNKIVKHVYELAKKNPQLPISQVYLMVTKDLTNYAAVEQIVQKILAFERAYEEILLDISNTLVEFDEEDGNKATQEFYRNNLPERISIDPTESMDAEQQVQQQVQQQMEVEQETIENVIELSTGDVSAKPLNFDEFKHYCLHGLEPKTSQSSYSWSFREWDVTFRSIATLDKDQMPSSLGKLFNNTFISERAYRLLRKGGRGGQPMFYMLVIQVKNRFTSCLVTPTDWEQTLKNGLLKERKGGNTDLQVALYAFESGKFDLMKMDFGHKQPAAKPEEEEFINILVANNLYVGRVNHWMNAIFKEKKAAAAANQKEEKKEEKPYEQFLNLERKRIIAWVRFWTKDFTDEDEYTRVITFFNDVLHNPNAAQYLAKEKDLAEQQQKAFSRKSKILINNNNNNKPT